MSFDLLPDIRAAGDTWFKQLFGGPLDFEIQQAGSEVSHGKIPIKQKDSRFKKSNEEIEFS